MMKFTPETSQSDSNSSNANFSVSLAVFPIARTLVRRSVTNFIKLSHLQKSSPNRGSLGLKRFNSLAPNLTSVKFKSVDANDNKKMFKSADAIDNKKMYLRLVSLLHGEQKFAERVINRVSDADLGAEFAVMRANYEEYLNLTAALSRAGNVDITDCQWESVSTFHYTDLHGMTEKDLIAYFKNLNRGRDFKDLVAEINDMEAPNNMLVNAEAIDNFKKLDRADAIDQLNIHLCGLMQGKQDWTEKVTNHVSDADWEAETAVIAARTQEVFNLTVALSLDGNVDITKCQWNSLKDYFRAEGLGITEQNFNELVEKILKISA